MGHYVTLIVSRGNAEGQTDEYWQQATSKALYSKIQKRAIVNDVRELLRRSPRIFGITATAALALRLLFVFAYPHVTDDSRIYADIAKNWLTHGIYGITDSGKIVPTYIRLPGYPAFLAATFALFGLDNFRAVLLLQVLVDLASCFVVADLARRILGNRAARAAFLLTVLCPFLANYAAAALTETLEIFFTALALDFAVVGVTALRAGLQHTEEQLPRRFAARNDKSEEMGEKNAEVSPTTAVIRLIPVPLSRNLMPWVWCGLAIFADISLRPDGGLLLPAIGLYVLVLLVRAARAHEPHLRVLMAGVLLTIFALGPFIPWTIRNWRVFHRFQPLTSRYANGPDDFVPLGFNHWVKTWMADYVSVEEIYWQEPGAKIDPSNLPERAFDSPDQKQATLEAINWYNETTEIDPELDAQFEALAKERIVHSKFRYYFWLPALRVADMWLRPRTELLPPDPRWWQFEDDYKWIALSLGFGAINLAYVLMAIIGIVSVACAQMTRASALPYLGLLVLFIVIRSAFLGTLENPEPRYTLECYSAVIVCAAALFREKSV
jgi:4-amino-4-deoxy-L-arabinose transferase-like glycosyltransferase